MAVKTSSLTFGTGPQVWFYTPADPASSPGSQNFPGIQNPGNCGAEVGDILIIKSVKALAPGGAFVPDSNGYMPHLAIYPGSNELADPNHETKGAPGQTNKHTAVPGWPWSNDQSEPCIRVNLGTVFLRWNCGSIQIEGGAIGVGGAGGKANTIAITYLWDRPKILERVGVQRHVPTGVKTHRFTLWNITQASGAPLIIQRPLCAARVWTPDLVTIQGNIGIYQMPLNFNNPQSVPLDCGPAESFTVPSGTSSLIFELDL